mgnify:CR=1 FL=1
MMDVSPNGVLGSKLVIRTARVGIEGGLRPEASAERVHLLASRLQVIHRVWMIPAGIVRAVVDCVPRVDWAAQS